MGVKCAPVAICPSVGLSVCVCKFEIPDIQLHIATLLLLYTCIYAHINVAMHNKLIEYSNIKKPM